MGDLDKDGNMGGIVDMGGECGVWLEMPIWMGLGDMNEGVMTNFLKWQGRNIGGVQNWDRITITFTNYWFHTEIKSITDRLMEYISMIHNYICCNDFIHCSEDSNFGASFHSKTSLIQQSLYYGIVLLLYLKIFSLYIVQCKPRQLFYTPAFSSAKILIISQQLCLQKFKHDVYSS